MKADFDEIIHHNFPPSPPDEYEGLVVDLPLPEAPTSALVVIAGLAFGTLAGIAMTYSQTVGLVGLTGLTIGLIWAYRKDTRA